MRKILTFALMLCGLLAFSQEDGAAPLSSGESQLNVGLGFGYGLPVFASYDIAVTNDITVAPQVGFNLDGFDYLILSGRGDYHFNRLIGIPSNWDFYAGLNLGFLLSLDDNAYSSGLDLGGQIGGRYYFSEKFGVLLEGGFGSLSSGGKVGLTIKM